MRSWCNGHHNLRCCPRVLPVAGGVSPVRLQGDYGRLARRLAGTSVGLVVGGGGAKGFAHFGVIQALEEAGMLSNYSLFMLYVHVKRIVSPFPCVQL